ncbi:MAG TPA: hypothetical protein VH985_00220 [Candidatus Binatia bacterium]
MRIFRKRDFLLPVLAATLMLIGCAATQIINQWSNPDYTAASFNRILVIGVSKQASLRRTFEDEFVAQLRAIGIDAVPSYEFIPEDAQVLESCLKEAVKQAGADGVIITRLVRVEKKADVQPGRYGPFPGFGFYRWYSSAWVGFYEPPRLNFYDIYISETSLYDVTKDQLVWSGIAKTTDLGDIKKEIKEYGGTVINALNKKNLLRPENPN